LTTQTSEPTGAGDLPSDQHHLIEHDVLVEDAGERMLILAAMCVALVAVIASVSGLNVAQQALAEDLGATQSELLWIINGYTLALAALLMPIGAIGDRWGRKPILMIGLSASDTRPRNTKVSAAGM